MAPAASPKDQQVLGGVHVLAGPLIPVAWSLTHGAAPLGKNCWGEDLQPLNPVLW